MGKKKKWQDHEGTVLDSGDGLDIIDCKKCGFKHVIPLPSLEEIRSFYKESFYDKDLPEYIEKRRSELDWWSIEQNIKYDFLEKNLPDNSKKKILDIGSGPGYFLKIGQERGWDVTGVEPGRTACKYAQNSLKLNVVNQLFSKHNHKELGMFNVINMNNVLEHILDPQEIIKSIYEILQNNGFLSITSPNDYNPFQKIVVEQLKIHPWWIVPKHHLNYFDIKSICKLLEKNNFKIIYKTASFPLELFILMGEDYISDKSQGKYIHEKRMRFEKCLVNAGRNDLRKDIYEKLASLGLGRTFTVIAGKSII